MNGMLPEGAARYLANAANVMHKQLLLYDGYARLAHPPKGGQAALDIAAREGCDALTHFIDDLTRMRPDPTAHDREKAESAVRHILQGNIEPFFRAERDILVKAGVVPGTVDILIDHCQEVLENVRAGRGQPMEFLIALGGLQSQACHIAAQHFGGEWAEEPREVIQQLRPIATRLKTFFKGVGGGLVFAADAALPVALSLHPVGLAANLALSEVSAVSQILGQAVVARAYADLRRLDRPERA